MIMQQIGMTDTDLKERNALVAVWPDIVLLLCIFHMSQCWKNKLNQLLGKGGGEEVVRLRTETGTQIRALLQKIKKEPQQDRIPYLVLQLKNDIKVNK